MWNASSGALRKESHIACAWVCNRYIGVAFAVATFIALVIMIWAKHHGEDIAGRIVDAFIIAVTIIVVAIPEVSSTASGLCAYLMHGSNLCLAQEFTGK